jgi:hypothetical protein
MAPFLSLDQYLFILSELNQLDFFRPAVAQIEARIGNTDEQENEHGPIPLSARIR